MKDKLKKISIFCITLILALIATCNFSIAIKARKYTTYEINLNDKVTVGRVLINGTEIPKERYISDKVKINQNGDLYTSENGKIKIISSVIDDIIINFNTDNYNNIEVLKDGTKQPMHDNLFMIHENMLQLTKSSLNKYSIVIFFVSYAILFLCVWEIKRILNKIKDNKIKLYDIVLFAISVFIIYFANIYYLIALFRYLIIIPIIVIIGIGIYYLKDSIKENLHSGYLILAVTLGITMLFLLPPFHVPDEAKHFIKSYEMSYGIVKDDGYVNLPVSLENFIYKYNSGALNYKITYNGKNYFLDLFEKGEYNIFSNNFTGYTNTRYLSIIPYIPSAIFIGIFRVVKFSPIFLILIGKLVNLLLTIIICYYSIKNIPKYKKTLFVVTLFPIFIQQAASVNMDYLTNLVIIFFVSNVMQMKYSKDIIKNKQLILIVVISIILAYCKFGYFPILLLVLLIPNSNFKNSKLAIIYKILIVLIPSFLSYLDNMSLGISENKPYYTFRFAIQHPLTCAKVYYNTALWRMDLDLFRGMFDGFGVSTKWNDPLILAILCIIYTLLIAIKDDNDAKFSKVDKILLLIPSLLIIGIVYSAMFFGWTYLGADKIDGLQPRYFIPAILCIHLCLTNGLFEFNAKNKNIIYNYLILSVFLFSLYTIANGFYNIKI